jgi:uncharacterized membrane protein
MKKVFFEVSLVITFTLVYLFVPEIRLPLIFTFGVLGIWLLPVQLFLSVSFKNWHNELSGRFHHLPAQERLLQIKDTFKSLDAIGVNKLRLFYINVSIFHYLLMMFYALSFLFLSLLFLGIGVFFNTTYYVAISLLGFIITCSIGYILIGQIFPAGNKENIDTVFYLFWSKDWQKQLSAIGKVEKDEFQLLRKPQTFYDFWRQGKTVEEKEMAFKKLIDDLNRFSKSGQLFKYNEQDKIELTEIIRNGAADKTLAGFLKYCIRDRKILSEDILKKSHRGLLHSVFMIGQNKGLVVLENERFKSLPDEYVEVYKSILKE